MKRREFITLLGGAAAWPLAARAQHGDRVRHIGVLTGFSENDREAQRRVTAFLGGLRELGWTDGRNVRIDYRWGAGDASRIRAYAAELVRLAPDVILVNSSSVLRPCSRKAAASQSYSCRLTTQSLAASLPAWRIRAATSLASPPLRPPWEASC